MTCQLCKNRAPDKKNAHIIPFFLIKSIVNPGETKRTGKEISFNLTKHGMVDLFVSRINQEEVDDLLGRELTEEELENGKNHYTQDDFICINCEDKFGRIESIFSSKIFQKIKEFTPNNLSDISLELNETESLLTQLFIYSIIWRLGASKFNGYILNETIIEKLAVILNTCLKLDEKEIAPHVLNHKNLFEKHKIAISYFERTEEIETRFVHIENNKYNPNCYFINGFTIFFFYKRKTLLRKGNKFYGLEKSINRKTIYQGNTVFCGKNTDEQAKNAVNSISDVLVKSKVREFRRNFIDCYKGLNNIIPNIRIVNLYLSELLDGSYKYADQYSLERIAKLCAKYCS